MHLMAVKGWVPHLTAKHGGFGGPWESSPCANTEASPFISRIMSSNIWLWIRPRESMLQVCRGIRVSDHSTAFAPFPAGPMTCRLMLGATCKEQQWPGQPVPLHHLHLVQRRGAQRGT